MAAQAFVTFDRFGRPFGVVPNGGSIVLGSTGGTDSQGNLISTDAFVIIRPGATLDASGTQAVLDLNAGANPLQNMMGPATTAFSTDLVQVSSNGGSISLSSYDGIYIDGSLRAAAGGPGGAGGALVISFIGPDYAANPAPFAKKSNPDLLVPNNLRQPRTIIIGQQPVASPLPSAFLPGQANPKLKVGYSYVSADAVAAGGFENLSFYASNSILFKGDVTLSAGESIKLFDTSIADTARNAAVAIVAPYVFFGGTTGLFQVAGAVTIPLANNPATAPVKGNAVLTVEADLIDLAYTAFGDQENVPLVTGSKPQSINFPAFKEVNFVSEGDIRFLSSANIKTPGSFTFTAAQLYPVTGANATVEAGFIFGNGNILPFAANTSISIYRTSNVDPALPQSVFGQLTLEAQTINQGGIVRAPLGAITLGVNGSPTTAVTKGVNFLAGSITSVSANGLTIPYGGTTDGVTYTVNGQTFTLGDVINGTSFSTSSRGIELQGESVSVAKGASLDLSGGGTLFGEGFISGRGGSLDVLSTALANQNPSNTFSSPSNSVYAIVPGVQAYAPATVDTNTGFTGSMPGIGQQITIQAGVPGLPPGTYTLMPANYALLPGALKPECPSNRGNHYARYRG